MADDFFTAYGNRRRKDSSPSAERESEETTDLPMDELATLRRELEEQSQMCRRYALRAQAADTELERAKERMVRDSAKEFEQKKRALLLSFLPVADDIDRAIDAAAKDGSAAMLEGVQLLKKSFLHILASHDVRHFVSLGEPFDPQLHQAMSRVPVAYPHEDGKIVAVLSEGYQIRDEVLRPAQVAVGAYLR